ncbi:MAG: NAD(P)/FAD-dependent oxidoreductase [Candidatus Omnitrophica bacterium]|nr:NAD(P)/FAD-dependent oxidoreductase [Candidatus Omnitrophota bacterium]
MGFKKNEYDVIVVGGGIAGLVCGGYLAKFGKKILIIEKNSQIGGYCSSFEKDKFIFDAGVHGIGGLHETGKTSKMIEELGLSVKFDNRQPHETVFFKNKYAINFWNDIKKTSDELIGYFPQEKQRIEEFINLTLRESPFVLFSKCRNKTFSQILNYFFKEEDLKSIFKIPGGNIGLSSNYVSALSMMALYREFLFNPSKYPIGSMQSFSDSLKNKCQYFGSEILTKKKVVKIIKNDCRYLIMTDDGNSYFSRKLVFNIDPIQAYKIGGSIKAISKFYKIVRFLTISPSAFFINIGLAENKNFSLNNNRLYNLWYFPQDDTSRGYFDLSHKFFASHYIGKHKGVFLSFPSERTLRVLIIAPFQNASYWSENKERISGNIITRAAEFLGGFLKLTKSISITTPIDLYRSTFNYKGACYGLIPATSLNNYYAGFATLDDNLFLCGHWVPNIFGGSGIASVVNRAITCSDFIIKNKKKNEE